MKNLIQLLFTPEITGQKSAYQKKTEHLVSRFERLQQLRQIAIEDKNIAKVWQCNRLIQDTTKKIKERYSINLNQ